MKALVLEVHGLHAGYLGCYGNEWVETPILDLLAAEGIVFDQHYADCPGARPRTAWTGRYSFPVPDVGSDPEAAAAASPLEALLTAQGIACRCGVERDRLAAALKRLKSADDWLLWIDGPSLHPPWNVPEEFLSKGREESDDEDETTLEPWLDPPVGPLDSTNEEALTRLQDTYATVVTWFDAWLGDLLEELDQRGLYEEVLLCVTAGRGLALGEHGIVGDARPWLHEEVLHVPLLLRLPGAAEAGRRVAALTQPVDLLPTLLAAFQLTAPADLHGHSLWPLVHGKAEQVRPYACSGWRLGERCEWALRTPEWGFLLPVRMAVDDAWRGPQLYVKPDDRWEVNDLRQHHLDWAEHLDEVLHGFVAAARRPGPLHVPALRELAALEQEG